MKNTKTKLQVNKISTSIKTGTFVKTVTGLVLVTKNPPNALGGAEISWRNLGQHFVKDGTNFFYLCYKDTPYADRNVDISGINLVRFYSWKNKLTRTLGVLSLSVWLLINSKKYQVVHFANFFSAKSTVDKVIQLAVAYILRNLMHKLIIFENRGVRDHTAERTVVKKLLKGSIDQFVALNMDDVQNWIKTGMDENRCSLMFNGFDSKKVIPLTKSQKRIRRRGLGIPEDAVIVTEVVGKLDEIKNSLTLLKTWELIENDVELANSILVVVGPDLITGRVTKDFKDLFNSLNLKRVHFVGVQDEPQRFQEVSDVFFHPSICEGMSRAVLESLALGQPVVGCDAVGMRGFINDEIGFLQGPNDIQGLYISLKKLITDEGLRTEMGAKAIKYVENQTFPDLLAEYKKLHQKGFRKKDE